MKSLSKMNTNELRQMAVELGVDQNRTYGVSKQGLVIMINAQKDINTAVECGLIEAEKEEDTMKPTTETIKKAVELEAKLTKIRGYESGMTEDKFMIFTEKELQELNAKTKAEIAKFEKEENAMTQSTFITKLGNTFSTNTTGTYFYMTDTEGKKIRIKKCEYEQAKREYELECKMDADEKIGLGDDEHEGLFDDLRTPEQEEEVMKEAEEWLAREDAKRGHKTAEEEQAELDEQPCKVEVDTDLEKPAEMDQYGGVDCYNCNVTHCVHRNCMRRNPKAVGGLGECPRLAIKLLERMEELDAAAEDPNVSLEEFCEMLSEDEKTTIEPAEAELLNNARKEKKTKERAKKTPQKPRKSKDIAYEGHGITLTAKQVDFINHLPDTCFWEMGVNSVIWCDVLVDDIGGQFTDKPMTVGAMISTLCEKRLGFRMTQRREGRKCTSFSLTDLGKEVAKELGLE